MIRMFKIAGGGPTMVGDLKDPTEEEVEAQVATIEFPMVLGMTQKGDLMLAPYDVRNKETFIQMEDYKIICDYEPDSNMERDYKKVISERKAKKAGIILPN